MATTELWDVRLSNTRRIIYFYNSSTKESCWTPPHGYTKEMVLRLKGAEEYRDQIENHFKGEKGQVRASHLLVKHRDSRRPSSWREARITRSKEEATKILEKYKAEIEEASDKAAKFTELATEHSDCSSHNNGGDLGWFGAGQMQEAFEKATYSLEVGDISDIVDTESGVHLIIRTG